MLLNKFYKIIGLVLSLIIIIESGVIIAIIKQKQQSEKINKNIVQLSATQSRYVNDPISNPNDTTESDTQLILKSKYLKDFDRSTKISIDFRGMKWSGGQETRERIYYVSWDPRGPGSLGKYQFIVNSEKKTVEPYFWFLSQKDDVLNSQKTNLFTIPNTKTTINLPQYLTITYKKNYSEINAINDVPTILGEVLNINSPDISKESYWCTISTLVKKDNDYCPLLSKALGGDDNLEKIAKKQIDVLVSSIEFNGTPYEWALDHAIYQGSTLRELERSGYKSGQTIKLNENEFYAIGLGCCGDTSYDYIIQSKNLEGKPILIFFHVNGFEKREKNNGNDRHYPLLESILRTFRQ